MLKFSTTEYGKRIKRRLAEIDQTQLWLIGEVNAITGVYFDGSYLNKIMTGRIKTPQVIDVINRILGLDETDPGERPGSENTKVF